MGSEESSKYHGWPSTGTPCWLCLCDKVAGWVQLLELAEQCLDVLPAARPMGCVALQVISGLPDGLEAPDVPTVQGKMLQGGPQMIQVCAAAHLRPA